MGQNQCFQMRVSFGEWFQTISTCWHFRDELTTSQSLIFLICSSQARAMLIYFHISSEILCCAWCILGFNAALCHVNGCDWTWGWAILRAMGPRDPETIKVGHHPSASAWSFGELFAPVWSGAKLRCNRENNDKQWDVFPCFSNIHLQSEYIHIHTHI